MKYICIYCGSNAGTDKSYAEAAYSIGQEIAKKGLGLVYGGSNVGLMGIVADSAMAAGARVIGVMPEGLVKMEVAHKGLTELHVVKSMHERKHMMAELSDGFIALPGGIGTAEEIFEAFTWMQLGIHLKPCAILNVNNYYDGLILQIKRMVKDQFLKKEQADQLIISESARDLIEKILVTKPVVLNKWLDREKMKSQI